MTKAAPLWPPLWPWSLFAAMIAAAGLPIYIHAPKFYVDTYGTSLTALGLTLAALRLIDVVQDPLLGWLAEAGRKRRAALVWGAAMVMALAMIGLFAIAPPIAPLAWFAITLALLFSGFSFLTIVFYAQGVEKAALLGPTGHFRLAGWRETGSLLGVSLAAVAPVVLGSFTDRPFTGFAAGFALLALVAVVTMRREWTAAPATQTPADAVGLFRPILADPLSRRLLLIALLNAAPVAVTSTLFLFFVESRLGAPGLEGPLLLLFFLSAAASAPFWSRSAARFGAKRSLLAAMALAIAAFLWAVALREGDALPFAVICAASGAALGADLTLLPALFARRLSALGKGEGAAFGLWSFMSKLSLALAAATLLPALSAAGFTPGTDNPPDALLALSLLYAALPCALKLIAMALLVTTETAETAETHA
ncbi:MAG: MFS transporter [Pseudotabrizicola sp.]|uniref:MFS transporter n=1 Tax=Pseudotabrizicola sp. TaxID=2939647 RepID=UPI0027313F55|nr:MFS transporter [Pseudotabrizicola sp.]MDP2082421.1 MFS transporter [Pseudotabrizicola sp.]MDZ7574174.1 MFS transporter [Pseudotabrizicola sp.]